ncbi:MAG: patatin-like phospholipase family protein [Deltaproteobacteria bacterium]|nr:patatin-like phospholipase family protein [Deltaproteobacteria bacterium]
MAAPARKAIVLSGGGARGAYEAGVLSTALEAAGGARVELLCGTSVGGIHAAIVASHADALPRAAEVLRQAWLGLEVETALSLWSWHPGRIQRVIRGGTRPASIFDGRPLARLVGRVVDWPGVARNLGSGALRALAVTATHVPTGRPTVFVDTSAGQAPPRFSSLRARVQPTRIAAPHLLASAAIPLLFPAVRVEGELHCDGGLRMNTPLAPALGMGADRVLVIAQSTARPAAVDAGTESYPGAAFLLGKVLNAFLLDHVVNDLEELQIVNRLLGAASAAGGANLLEKLAAGHDGAPGFRHVEPFVIRPSDDIGALAHRHLHRLSCRPPTTALLRVAESGWGGVADLASYLLFDRAFTTDLFELGRADAEAQRETIAAFFA